MVLLSVLIGVFSWCTVYVAKGNGDHDVFEKQAHLYELDIQVQRMHEKLYAKCPNTFQTPDSALTAIIGRRRSVDAPLDLKIDLAEKTLEKLILKYGNCTSKDVVMTSQTSTETAAQKASTETTIKPTSTQSTTAHLLHTTTRRHQHAFQVLRSKNITYKYRYSSDAKGYDFLALEVRVPADGLSKSSNWCYDYQYLCEDFHRRPTGCSIPDQYTDCRDNYNSDMNIENTLGCNPADGIADLANIAFPNLSPPAHANHNNCFGFFDCHYCNKTLQSSSRFALAYMWDFWGSNGRTFYTVCR